jgi:hypothetical protein
MEKGMQKSYHYHTPLLPLIFELQQLNKMQSSYWKGDPRRGEEEINYYSLNEAIEEQIKFHASLGRTDDAAWLGKFKEFLKENGFYAVPDSSLDVKLYQDGKNP